MSPNILAIDQGTTSSKTLLVGPDGSVSARGSHSLAIETPRPGWFEQDAEQLWQVTMAAVDECLVTSENAEIVGVAISNQRESVVAWRRSSGEPLTPVLGWQDARTTAFCQGLTHAADYVHVRTGLRLDPMFSAPKIRWLIDSLDGPLDDICVGTVDAYLIARLTGACLTDAGNASRTLLFDLRELDWSDALLDVFGVPRSVLPDVKPSNTGFGEVRAGLPVSAGVPVVAALGDSHAALYGHGITTPGASKVTYGTGSSVMAPLAALGDMPDAVSTTLAWLTDQPCYAREGNILATGAGIEALVTLLRLPDATALATLARRSDGSRLSYVPAFSGLGAPYWDRDAVGVLVGLGRNTTAAEVAWAGLDAVAQQVCDVLDAMHDRLDVINAGGGASTNAELMQLQADLSGLPVRVADIPEGSALGVARLAWAALGSADEWAAPNPEHVKQFQPEKTDEWRAAQRGRWRDAVSRSRGQRDEDNCR